MATAIGVGRKEVEEFFEKEYKNGMTVDDGISLALRALKKTTEAKLKPENVDISFITLKENTFKVLSDPEIEKFLTKA
jgi:proteasome alpha subunit